MKTRDDPSVLLSRPKCRYLVLRKTPTYLNTMFKPCCYSEQNRFEIFKWEPNDPKFDITNGKLGRRVLKSKEVSNLQHRFLTTSGCRGYQHYHFAEYNRKILYVTEKDFQPSCLCFKRPQISVYQIDEEMQDNDLESLLTTQAEKDETRDVQSSILGKAIIPFSIFSFKCSILDRDDNPIFHISGSKF